MTNIAKITFFERKKHTPKVKGKSFKMVRKFHENYIEIVSFSDSRLRIELHKERNYDDF